MPPNVTVPAAGYANVVQCAPKTRCLTAELLPIGTPTKVLVTGWVVGKFNEHPEYGSALIRPGRRRRRQRLSYRSQGHARPRVRRERARLHGAVHQPRRGGMYVWTQDYQILPISFGDPRTGAPNAFTLALSMEGLLCRRSNVEATAYISGPPTLILPKR